MQPSIPLLYLSVENSITFNKNPVFFRGNKDNKATSQHSPVLFFFIGFSCNPHVLRTKGRKNKIPHLIFVSYFYLWLVKIYVHI